MVSPWQRSWSTVLMGMGSVLPSIQAAPRPDSRSSRVTCTFTVGAAPFSSDADGEAAAISIKVMTASRSFCSLLVRMPMTSA